MEWDESPSVIGFEKPQDPENTIKTNNIMNRKTKEPYAPPFISKEVELEQRDSLLTGSVIQDVEMGVVSIGHEYGGEYTISNDYWETNY